ncbi:MULTISPECIES: fimbrial protein [Providencia]|uniref:Fimbrial protein n=5 Tax=Providencia TaxID=586 RepID=A0AAJ4NJU0_PRORE|nr:MULTISPECIES: fimbrial protein [Providencia]MBC8654921.1 type 1 fimbrial protein [Providencia vermicola]APC09855.1 Major MR/P fimbria protein precursor [Providencia rettgeri]AVL73510.1 type 1 fimbrial protein [Providencia rettgeri]EIL1984742.1 type 1 fimbrial protein [Providencia rettgeri]EIU7557747.1 type 1 fimbrial protein [Providencia rettgeri]
MNRKSRLNWVFYLLLFTFPALAYSEEGLDMEFRGELVNTACQVTTESLNQKIKIYNLRLKTINEGIPSATEPFSIFIEKCSETDLKKIIKLTWKSNKLTNIDGDSFLNTQGDSGVLLGITDKDDSLIVWNQQINFGIVPEVGNTQELNFGVFVRKPKSGDAKTGDFLASVTFTVEYE